MPAKKPDKKAPANQTEEDLSDLSSLPHIRTFTVSTLYHFYMQQNRDEVKDALNSMLSEEGIATNEELKHVKSITRASIIEAAQGNTNNNFSLSVLIRIFL